MPCRKVLFLAALLSVPVTAQEIDPLQVRPSLVEPRVSLPTELITVPVVNPSEYYVPPLVEDIPDDKYGDMVRWGREIFVNTQNYGQRFTGNGLNCSSCHLSEGRQPYAVPLWAAYGMYPQYRAKNREVVTIQERIQDCFRYSLDGIAPTLDTPEVEALVTYMHWLSKDVPIGVELPGRGLAVITRTRSPSHINGEIVYETRCSMCHGENGQGQKYEHGKGYMFPPLWGSDSFNRGAGMNKIRKASQYIKANMPLGAGYTLKDMEAWDVSNYMWIHYRPFDPRVGWFLNTMGPKPGGGF